MRYFEIISEYQFIRDPPFTMPDFTNGKAVGTINAGFGPLRVWRIKKDNFLQYAAIDGDENNKDRLINPIGYLGFEIFYGVIVARNALTDSKYAGKGVCSELFLFVNQVEKHKIISDTQLSFSGEALWNKLIHSNKFSSKILYIPTKELFDIKDIGKKKTADGEMVQSPKDDFFFDDFYNSATGKGQRFFYLLENKKKFIVEKENGITFRFGVCESSHRTNVLQTIRYFKDGEP